MQTRPEYKPERGILASFWKDSGGRLWLNSVTAFEEEIVEAETAHEAVENARNPCGALNHYDVDWCQRDKTYCYDLSGGGGGFPLEVDGIYWAAEGISVREKPSNLCNDESRKLNRTRRLKKLPRSLRSSCREGVLFHEDPLEFLHYEGINEDTAWCSICGDNLPDNDLCSHTWWCDELGLHSTPNEPVSCDSEDCYACRQHDPKKESENERYACSSSK